MKLKCMFGVGYLIVLVALVNCVVVWGGAEISSLSKDPASVGRDGICQLSETEATAIIGLCYANNSGTPTNNCGQPPGTNPSCCTGLPGFIKCSGSGTGRSNCNYSASQVSGNIISPPNSGYCVGTKSCASYTYSTFTCTADGTGCLIQNQSDCWTSTTNGLACPGTFHSKAVSSSC